MFLTLIFFFVFLYVCISSFVHHPSRLCNSRFCFRICLRFSLSKIYFKNIQTFNTVYIFQIHSLLLLLHSNYTHYYTHYYTLQIIYIQTFNIHVYFKYIHYYYYFILKSVKSADMLRTPQKRVSDPLGVRLPQVGNHCVIASFKCNVHVCAPRLRSKNITQK